MTKIARLAVFAALAAIVSSSDCSSNSNSSKGGYYALAFALVILFFFTTLAVLVCICGRRKLKQRESDALDFGPRYEGLKEPEWHDQESQRLNASTTIRGSVAAQLQELERRNDEEATTIEGPSPIDWTGKQRLSKRMQKWIFRSPMT